MINLIRINGIMRFEELLFVLAFIIASASAQIKFLLITESAQQELNQEFKDGFKEVIKSLVGKAQIHYFAFRLKRLQEKLSIMKP